MSGSPQVSTGSSSPDEALTVPRLLGNHDAGPGPVVVATGGVHGNEPAGVEAIRMLLDDLRTGRVRGRGTFHGIAGNRKGLARDRRFLDRDLNRGWTDEALRALFARPRAELEGEDAEAVELAEALIPITTGVDRPVILIDLHTTSGGGAPFVAMADVLRNRRPAFAIPLPVILGLEEAITGSLLGWFCHRGHVGIAIEGGAHRDPEAAGHLLSALRLAMMAVGALEPDADLQAEDEARLAASADGLPRVLEIRHRHRIPPGATFAMRPGFQSFQPIRAGVELADQDGQTLVAGEDALMLMPLYQAQGEDGYFLARPVKRFWLRLSALLRRTGLDHLVPLLPGVRRATGERGVLLVDPRVARFRTRDVLHLFGFRQGQGRGETLVFHRREPVFRAALHGTGMQDLSNPGQRGGKAPG